MIAMKCTDCGKEFEIELPVPETINQMTVSMIVFAHTEIPCCPHCGASYRFEVVGAKQFMMGFKRFEMPKGPESSSIVVPGAMDFSKLKKH